jgi:APA family basic amino acid/polyamine antiporter
VDDERQHNQGIDTERRVIGGWGSLSIVAGSMLGIGIFIVPPLVAQYVESEWMFYLIWLFGGLVAISGAVACAELGAMFPRAGGGYVYQREAFGKSMAFASGWVLFGAVFTGSIAGIAVPFCEYQLPLLLDPVVQALGGSPGQLDLSASVFGLPIHWAQVAGVGLIAALTGLNIVGTRLSTLMQTIVTIVPIIILAGLSVYAVTLAGATTIAPVVATGEGLNISYLVLAYLAVYFAYSGWDCVIYVAGEVKRPSRNLPLGLIGGALAATALYMLMCYAYIEVLGLDGLRHAGEAGTATARELGGPTAELVVTGLIALALMGALNGTILGGARVAYAMAKDGAMSDRVGRIDEGRQVPKTALVLQALLASVFVLTGTFEQIIALVSMAMILTGMFTVGSLFVLRIRQPHAERPYRALGYPILPAIYLVSSVFVLVVMVFSALQSSRPGAWYPVLGLVIMLAAYLYHRIRKSRPSPGSRITSR